VELLLVTRDIMDNFRGQNNVISLLPPILSVMVNILYAETVNTFYV
jgi:hypothetical protein